MEEQNQDWQQSMAQERLPVGVVAVGLGEGINAILESMGANVVVNGGQTMNPSAEDLVQAIAGLQADSIIVLPNNSNVILTAEQAAHMSGRPVRVVPTRIVEQTMGGLQVYFMVDTLEYLQRGGRIGKAQAFLGSLLNVKPICVLKEGIIYPCEKARGKAKALDRLIHIAAENFPAHVPLWCSVVHGDDPDGAYQLKEKAEKRLRCSEIIVTEVGPVVGTHAGPGVLGLIACPDTFPSR